MANCGKCGNPSPQGTTWQFGNTCPECIRLDTFAKVQENIASTQRDAMERSEREANERRSDQEFKQKQEDINNYRPHYEPQQSSSPAYSYADTQDFLLEERRQRQSRANRAKIYQMAAEEVESLRNTDPEGFKEGVRELAKFGQAHRIYGTPEYFVEVQKEKENMTI